MGREVEVVVRFVVTVRERVWLSSEAAIILYRHRYGQ
jgi:hypothetical protein